MSPRAFICGCAGLALSEADAGFIKSAQPWGLILFRRNIDTPQQVAGLVRHFREITGRADAPVLIDQEGGRVQRLNLPHWRAYPNARQLAACGREAVILSTRLMAHDMATLGINIDCLPVLDVPVAGGHEVIGNRAYSLDGEVVASMGRAAAEALMAGGVLPVMKHIPGHGRAGLDTHLALPIVTESRAVLEASDFAPFRACRDLPIAMTAHVVFSGIDPENPATLSAKVIREIVRGFIGFDGLLLSDDLSMKALSGTFHDKTTRLFAAGVDIALHCNGDIGEAEEVAAATPVLAGRALQRAQAALACLGKPQAFDPVDAARKLDEMLAVTA